MLRSFIKHRRQRKVDNSTMFSSDDNANKSMAKYLKDFYQSVMSGKDELKDALSPSARAKAKKRTISTLMNDLVTHNLHEKISNSFPQVRYSSSYGQLKLIFPEGFLMKCKQSNRKRLSFISTQTMFAFMNQLETMFPGMPSPYTNIVLTYQFNKTRTEIEKMSLVCPANEHKYRWELPVAFTPEMLPITESESLEVSEQPIEPKRIVPKAKNVKKSKKGTVKKDEQKGKENKS